MLAVTHLTCESLMNPMAIDVRRPRFSWQIVADRRNVRQTAYRLQVAAGSAAFDADLLWDSGRVESDQSLYVPYGGPALTSRSGYAYRVKVWDNHGQESAWSDIGRWEMGILNPEEWRAEWVTHPFRERAKEHKPGYYFRKVFWVTKEVKRARVYASALGLYELYVNGQRAGEELFTPGLTEYRHHIQYQAYDVAPHLRAGRNVLGVVLGEGWYRGRYEIKRRNCWGRTGAILVQMHLEYQDGSEDLVVSDSSWRVSTGPILLSDLYDGEVYDARLETPWLDPAFDDRDWAPARRYGRGPTRRLVAPLCEPVRRQETLPVQRVLHTPSGETVLDFGQNMVGWVRLRVKGHPGQRVVVDLAEILDKEGNFYRKNYRTARSQLVYICRGAGEEVFEPHFTYFGFRYARVTNYDAVDRDTLAGVVIHSDLRPAGRFHCSDPLLNQLQRCIWWGERGNLVEIPTDCPQRDERLGWTGDAQVFFRTATFNFDVGRFFAKWLKDLAVSHAFTGAVPFWVPSALRLPVSSAGWGDAAVIVPWQHYLAYGDRQVLEGQYTSMVKWLRYARAGARWPKWRDLVHPRQYWRREQYIWDSGFHLGDWLAPREGPKEWMAKKAWTATAYYAHSAHLLAEVAAILGRDQDAEKYRRLFERVRQAFCERFLRPDGTIAGGFQTAYVLALAFDLLPEAVRPQAARHLAEDIQAHGDHLTTGFLGTPHICFALSDHGQIEAAYRLLLQRTCPSWLYPITMGATTIWERWDGLRPDGSPNEAAVGGDNMVSFNHYAFGAVGDWLYRVVAGLDMDPSTPAYRRLLIHPRPGGGLDHAEAEHESPYGVARVAWQRTSGAMRLAVSVPANTSARIVLPQARVARVRTGEGWLADCARGGEGSGYGDIREEGDAVSLEVGSGDYTFEWEV